MASRTPRRTFLAPFVITLGALPGCAGSASPPAAPPPGPQPTVVTAQQDPQPEPVVVEHVDHPPTYVVANPPRPHDVTTAPPPPPPPVLHGPPPSIPDGEHHWMIQHDGARCVAFLSNPCPPSTPAAVVSCNPPIPQSYPCPPGLSTTATLEIVQYTPDGACYEARPPMQCPAGAMCNPPPPRAVACPH